MDYSGNLISISKTSYENLTYYIYYLKIIISSNRPSIEIKNKQVTYFYTIIYLIYLLTL
jgi:hypothetical protein